MNELSLDEPIVRLEQLATARSGDKGNHANIGVVAFDPEGYEFLRQRLTAERVAEFFHALGATSVERYELPGALCFNFVLYNALAGGASRSLRIDTQGKLLGTAILELALTRASAPRVPTAEFPTEPGTSNHSPARDT